MTKKAEEATEEAETKEVEKTPAEIAAEERIAAAEARAAEKEAEAERYKAEAERAKAPAPATGFTLNSWSDAEWQAAEESTGKTRLAILNDLNAEVRRDAKIKDAVSVLQAKQAFRDELGDAFDNDPLSVKYKGESKKFLADINLPDEVIMKPESRKMWIQKAIEFGKRGVKTSTQTRKADNMDTKETGKVTEKGQSDDEFSVEEREVIESRGRTVEDYKKLAHPYIKDGILLKEKLEEPRFGPK